MGPLSRVFALVFSLLGLFFVQPGASAHVIVVSTSPGDQVVLKQLPTQVVIECNSPLLLIGQRNPNSVDVQTPSGKSAVHGQVRVAGSKVAVRLNQNLIETGDYTVSYRLVSADGHSLLGSYRFRVSQPLSPTGSPQTSSPGDQVEPESQIDGAAGPWSRPWIYAILSLLLLAPIAGWLLRRPRFAHRK